MRRLSVYLAAALLVVPLVVVQSAAASPRVCQNQHIWTFVTPLTVSIQNGTVSTTYNSLCFYVGADPTLHSGSGSFNYQGTCAFALLNTGTLGLLIGGSVAITTAPLAPNTYAYALVPKDLCPLSTARAAGVGTGFDNAGP